MAQNIDVECSADAWTELTNADVSAMRIQNEGPQSIVVMATTGTSAPASEDGGVRLRADSIIAANVDLADLFPGVTPGYRVWAMALGFEAEATVSVSHA